jgi:itaconate CoA-transferase
MAEWMSFPLYYAFDGAKPPPRAGAAHATIYPYGPFPAGDGKSVMLGLQNDREWALFCERVLQRPELVADERFASNSKRVANRQALRALIVEVFGGMSAEDVVQRLEEAQIANARINDMHDLWEHEQLAARSRWVNVQTPAGAVPAMLPPGISDPDAARMDAVPALGQHTDNILAELGYSSEAIGALRKEQVI